MSPEEQKHLDEIQETIRKMKISAYDFMAFISQMDEDGLKDSGHKSKEAGYAYTLANAETEIRKVESKHFRKFPD